MNTSICRCKHQAVPRAAAFNTFLSVSADIPASFTLKDLERYSTLLKYFVYHLCVYSNIPQQDITLHLSYQFKYSGKFSKKPLNFSSIAPIWTLKSTMDATSRMDCEEPAIEPKNMDMDKTLAERIEDLGKEGFALEKEIGEMDQVKDEVHKLYMQGRSVYNTIRNMKSVTKVRKLGILKLAMGVQEGVGELMVKLKDDSKELLKKADQFREKVESLTEEHAAQNLQDNHGDSN